MANLVCRDFDLVRELEGRTPRQEHTIGGTFRLSAGPDSIRVQPVFPDDVIRVKVALPDASWTVVREALSTQDRLTRCGLLVDPDKVVERLKALALEGFRVKLPAVMFRGFHFPGTIERTARIEGRPVAVGLRTQNFEVTPSGLWSRAAIGIGGGERAGTTAREIARTQSASASEAGELSEHDCPHRPPRVRSAADVAGGQP